MNKNIVCFDVETTGLSDKNDYIIQLAAIKFDRDSFDIIDKRNWYIKPIHQYEISPDAFAAHGLSKEWIDENGDDLREVAPIFLDFIKNCDYLTYNGNSFDIKFIAKDLALCGFELPIENVKCYDSYIYECKKHPRTLSNMFKNYTGEELVDAHNAFSDVQATIEVFKHQIQADGSYDDINSWNESNILTPDGSIRRTNLFDKEVIVFNMGKHKDEEFCKVFKEDYKYIKWYMENIASNYTKRILRDYYNKNK